MHKTHVDAVIHFLSPLAINFSVAKSVKSTKDHVLDVILDVEKYSEFIPWCEVKIVSKNGNKINTKVKINRGVFSYSFDCVLEIDRKNGVISMSGSKLLQFSFAASWTISQNHENSEQIEVLFKMHLDIPVKIIENKVKSAIQPVANETISLFLKRTVLA